MSSCTHEFDVDMAGHRAAQGVVQTVISVGKPQEELHGLENFNPKVVAAENTIIINTCTDLPVTAWGVGPAGMERHRCTAQAPKASPPHNVRHRQSFQGDIVAQNYSILLTVAGTGSEVVPNTAIAPRGYPVVQTGQNRCHENVQLISFMDSSKPLSIRFVSPQKACVAYQFPYPPTS